MDALTVAVGIVPHRTDGMLSLHVGPSCVLLTPAEVRRLAADMLAKCPQTGAGLWGRVPVYSQDMP